ncbi:hypothetical protein P154DRAFT_576603 [Amniculicola lignicola CBS 123094]|uniref:Rhodopsin domain-containing protein n=1 Tax=Amniculicola lignicola CBS 123094 TaxID=1392246 RepID=A0A6A5WEC6_9PLEO|nr:hypothetical protein P154DRAFT_576603 [Amniculicola lignicola CBS 123094]
MALTVPPGMTYAQFRAFALELPAMKSPNGVHNYENPSNLVDWDFPIAQWTIGSVLVLIRLYTKSRIVKKVLIEDYWLLAAWLVWVGAWLPLVIMILRLPLGVHQWDMTVRHLIRHLYLLHVITIGYAVTMMLLKISIILQIIRIFTPTQTRRYTHWLLLTFMWINIVFYLVLILFWSFSCKPIAKAWDPLIQGGHCNHKGRRLFLIVSAAINTTSDFIILVLPQPVIWSLILNNKKKWGLSAVFLVGIFACICSILRTYYTTILYRTEDTTYWAARMGRWTDPEISAGFVVASLPMVPAFYKHLAGSSFISSISTSLRFSRWSSRSSSQPYSSGARSQGSGKGNRKIKKEIITDIEFHDLVARSRTEVGSVRSEGNRSADLEAGRPQASVEMVIERPKMVR